MAYIFKMGLILVPFILADIEIKCPVAVHWGIRALQKCEIEEQYTCLLNRLENQLQESCQGPQVIPKGYKFVLQPDFHNSKCAEERFQPLNFFTNGNSDCVFFKSKCNEEGQFVANPGSTEQDISCSCDTQKGYTYINPPRNYCSCNPIEEDCSCYLHECIARTSDVSCIRNSTNYLLKECKDVNMVKNNGFDLGNYAVWFNPDYNERRYNIRTEEKSLWILVVICLASAAISIMLLASGALMTKNIRNYLKDSSAVNYKTDTKQHSQLDVLKNPDVDLHATQNTESTEHTKLDVLKQLSENKWVSWQERDKIYYETTVFQKIKKRSLDNNCITIIGASGDGKTVTAVHVANHFYGNSYEVLIMNNPDKLLSCLDLQKQQVFIVDDPLGKQNLDEVSLSKWVTLSKSLKDSFANKNTKIIATIRKNLYQKYEARIKETIFSTNVEDLSAVENHLSRIEKEGILTKNIKGSLRHTIDEKTERLLYTGTYFPGFPLMCHIISKQEEATLPSISDPYKVIMSQVEDMKATSNISYCCLALSFLHEGTFDINDLTFSNDLNYIPCPNGRFSANETSTQIDSFDEEKVKHILNSCGFDYKDPSCIAKLKSEFNSLSGIYFNKSRTAFTILHDSITTAVALSYGNENLKTILRYCTPSFIREFVRTECVLENQESQDGYITVPSKYYNSLAVRFINDIKVGHISDVFLNPSFQDKKFLKSFSNHIDKISRTELRELMMQIPKNSTTKLRCIVNMTKFALDFAILSSTAIHWICKLGCLDLLKTVLSKMGEQKSFINHLPGHTTPLHFAAGYGNFSIVEYLLKLGVDVNAKSSLEKMEGDVGEYYSGFTPLLYAARQNHKDVVKLLLQRGADPDLVRDHGGSPMLLAADRGHTEVIKTILEFKGDPNICCDHGTSPLILASQEGHIETVQLLLNKGANANKQKGDGTSALFAAAKRGKTACCLELIRNGAKLDLCIANGTSPLAIAKENNHTETVKAILELSN